MKKILVPGVLVILWTLFITPASAQMMGIYQPTATPSVQDLQDIQTGQDLYQKFQNKQVSCDQLRDDDFEKIGEYVMQQQFGNTQQHIAMNERIKQMMAESGEEQMHIQIAKNSTGCQVNRYTCIRRLINFGSMALGYD